MPYSGPYGRCITDGWLEMLPVKNLGAISLNLWTRCKIQRQEVLSTLSAGKSFVSSCCDHSMLASMLSVSNSSVFTPALLKTQSCFLCYPRKPQNVSQSFHLVKMLRRPFIFWLYTCKIWLLTLIDSPICTWWLVELFITKAGESAHH